ncbi:MAG: peptidase C39 family protein [Anaerolineales bacterium]|nr:peptidase C39 family protein [Anaerolineales bacterium]
MPKRLLDVPLRRQRAESDCLPACAQMVVEFAGRAAAYEQIRELLGTRWFGTPAVNLLRLEKLNLRVELAELPWPRIQEQLEQGRPVIAFVSTGDLPYWGLDTDHAVVVVGFDDERVFVNDPYFDIAPQTVPRTAFELAQLRFNHLCAVVTVS